MTTVESHHPEPAARLDARAWLAAVPGAARRHACAIRRAAMLAAAWAIAAAALTPTQFEASARVTTLFDDDRATSIALDLAGGRGLPAGVDILVAPSRGRLFPVVLASRGVCTDVLSRTFRWHDGRREHVETLYAWLGTDDPDAARRILTRRVATFRLDPETGVTTIRVRAGSPELAEQIAAAFVDALGRRLDALREVRVAHTLAVVEAKIRAARAELAEHERALRDLRARNHDWRTSTDPDVRVPHDRLAAEVDVAAAVVGALEEQAELVRARRLDRGRRVTVVSPPSIPTRVAAPRWGRALALAAALALAVASTMAAALATWETAPAAVRRRAAAASRLVRMDLATLRARAVRALARPGSVGGARPGEGRA